MENNPWESNWSDIEVEQQTTTPNKNPWEGDWGLMDYVRAVPSMVAMGKKVAGTIGEAYDFNKVFIKLVGAESGNRHYGADGNLLTSKAGARGVTQVMRKTGEDPGYGVTPLQNQSREEYMRFGKDYLRAMLNEFGGDYRKAVAAYNAGPGSVQKAVATAEKKGGDWTQYLPKKSETIPYMQKILGEG